MFNTLKFFPKCILLELSKLLACAASCSRELHSVTVKGINVEDQTVREAELGSTAGLLALVQ